MSKPQLLTACGALILTLLMTSAAQAQSGPVVAEPRTPDASVHASADTPGSSDAAPARPLRYLLVGDSMAWAIGLELEPLIEARGDHFTYKSKISASIRGWSSGKHIREQIKRYKPDAVIIVLGTNESQIPYPAHLETPIGRIIDAVGHHACYWIGPPTWRGGGADTGVVALLARADDRCHFFDSMPLDLERRPDKIHPSRAGSKAWAEAILRWLDEHPPTATQQPIPAP